MCALIPAAGRGARFGAPHNKVFAPLRDRPLLGWTLAPFAACPEIDDIVLIGSEDDLPRLREIGEQYGGGKVRAVVPGGSDRQESVRRGLAACPEVTEWVVVHDGARPCVSPALLAAVLDAAREHDAAAIAAVPVADSLLRGHDGGDHFPDDTVSRDHLWAVQTPQVFSFALLTEAHAVAAREGFVATDDAALVRRMGRRVRVVRGEPGNLKVTRAEDLALAAAVLDLTPRHPLRGYPALPDTRLGSLGEGEPEVKSEGYTASPKAPLSQARNEPARRGGLGGKVSAPPFRIGHGYDVHPFADAGENRTLYLGGIAFPEAPRGMKAHSDGDVLLHAVCDALLGAAGMGDIGKLFPPSDMRHKDRPSIEFLREVAQRLGDAGWVVGNVDVTVLAESPKIGPRADAIKAKIAVELGIDPAQVGIKATTNEGMGFVGRGEGIAVHAAALLLRSE